MVRSRASAKLCVPIWRMAAFISSAKNSATKPGPSDASAPSPYMNGRPEKTNSAPRAMARTTSIPLRIPLSNITLVEDPTAFTIAGNASMAGGAASSWRPPWLETMTPSTPAATALSASPGCSRPFTTSAPGQASRNRFTSSQVNEPPDSRRTNDVTSFALGLSPA